jgi:hypothetical protein
VKPRAPASRSTLCRRLPHAPIISRLGRVKNRKLQGLETNSFRPNRQQFTRRRSLSQNCCRREDRLDPACRTHRVPRNAQRTDEPVKRSDKSSRGVNPRRDGSSLASGGKAPAAGAKRGASPYSMSRDPARRHYNRIRPHASLGYKPPAPEVYVPALAAWQAALRRTAAPATLAPKPTLN